MKRTQVDPKKLQLKRRTIGPIDPRALKDVTGGRGGGGTDPSPTTCGSDGTRTCPRW